MSRAKAPAYQWYPRDYMADAIVQAMTLAQEGAYRRLLDHCWLEHGLPVAVDDLWPLAKATSREQFEAELWPILCRKFYEKNGRLHNRRLDRERRKQAKTRRVRQLAARDRWKQQHSEKDAKASDLQCLTSSSSTAFTSADRTDQDQDQPALPRRPSRAVEKSVENPAKVSA